MKKYFQKLYQYNGWADQRVLECLKTQKISDVKILSLMGHVMAAQMLWLHRIKNLLPPAVALWGNYSLDELMALHEKTKKEWLTYIEREENFDRDLHYTNYTGSLFTNSVEIIMIHVVNHSTYHRAQVAMLLRQGGMEPVNTDFITYDRVIRGQLS